MVSKSHIVSAHGLVKETDAEQVIWLQILVSVVRKEQGAKKKNYTGDQGKLLRLKNKCY